MDFGDTKLELESKQLNQFIKNWRTEVRDYFSIAELILLVFFHPVTMIDYTDYRLLIDYWLLITNFSTYSQFCAVCEGIIELHSKSELDVFGPECAWFFYDELVPGLLDDDLQVIMLSQLSFHYVDTCTHTHTCIRMYYSCALFLFISVVLLIILRIIHSLSLYKASKSYNEVQKYHLFFLNCIPDIDQMINFLSADKHCNVQLVFIYWI